MRRWLREVDVPFVGKLLKVKTSEQEWKGAMERLLRNLGLRLLVPERHVFPVMSMKIS